LQRGFEAGEVGRDIGDRVGITVVEILAAATQLAEQGRVFADAVAVDDDIELAGEFAVRAAEITQLDRAELALDPDETVTGRGEQRATGAVIEADRRFVLEKSAHAVAQ